MRRLRRRLCNDTRPHPKRLLCGTADWDTIAAVKQAVKIPVIGNGDVTDPEKAVQMVNYTGVDGVMVGRAALGAPWLISQIHNYIHNGTPPQKPSPPEIRQILLQHLQALVDYYGIRLALAAVTEICRLVQPRPERCQTLS